MADDKPSKTEDIQTRQVTLDGFIDSAVKKIHLITNIEEKFSGQPLPIRCKGASDALKESSLNSVEENRNETPFVEEKTSVVTTIQKDHVTQYKHMIDEIKKEAQPADDELEQLKSSVQNQIEKVQGKILQLKEEARNGSFPFYTPDELAGRKAEALEYLLRNLDTATTVRDYNTKLTTFAHNYINNQGAGGNEVDLNQGRGWFTKQTGIDTGSTSLIKNLQEAVADATPKPSLRAGHH